MKYTRKTRDSWEVQQYTGTQYGWECVTAGSPIDPPPGTPPSKRGHYASGRADALARLKEYRDNQPKLPARIRKVRVPITPAKE